MTKEKKAELLDAILLKFEGNKSFTEKEIHEKEFYESINSDFFVVENNLNYLIGDEMIQRMYYSDGLNSETKISYGLTSKGFATMTDLANLGYVVKYKENQSEKKIGTQTLLYAKWAVILTALSIAVAVIGLIKCGTH